MEWLFKAIIEKKNTTKYKTIKALNGLKDIFRNVVEFSKTIPQFIVSAVGIMSMYSSRPLKKKFKIKNILIWEKNNTSMGDLKGSYAPKYEMIIFAHKGRKLLNGFRYADIIKASRTGNKNHPTEKPVDLLETFIKNSSDESSVVFDGFMGSGSTGVACVNTNRHFIGIELDEGYFNIAKERIEKAIMTEPRKEN